MQKSGIMPRSNSADGAKKAAGFSTPGRQRSRSLPSYPTHFNVKGIMKFKTLDESLHSTYGCETDNDNSNKPRIQFKHIEVREYARTVGDNPSCSSGPPVTISWEYNPDTMILSVEEYEDTRPTRRTMGQMVLPRSYRTEMLRKEWNVSQQQIASAVRQGIRCKSQRRTTLGNLGKTDRIEEMVEGATKQLLRTLFLRKSTSRTIKEMDEKMKLAQQQRIQYIMEHTMKDEYGDISEEQQTKGELRIPPPRMPGTPSPSENDDESISEVTGVLDNARSGTLSSSTSVRETSHVAQDKGPKRPFYSMDDSSTVAVTEQESGESASQTQKSKDRLSNKPIIKAIEPSDDLPATPVEC